MVIITPGVYKSLWPQEQKQVIACDYVLCIILKEATKLNKDVRIRALMRNIANLQRRPTVKYDIRYSQQHSADIIFFFCFIVIHIRYASA